MTFSVFMSNNTGTFTDLLPNNTDFFGVHIKQYRQFVLVITCLGGRFGINCPSEFLKILKYKILCIETNIF